MLLNTFSFKAEILGNVFILSLQCAKAATRASLLHRSPVYPYAFATSSHYACVKEHYYQTWQHLCDCKPLTLLCLPGWYWLRTSHTMKHPSSVILGFLMESEWSKQGGIKKCKQVGFLVSPRTAPNWRLSMVYHFLSPPLTCHKDVRSVGIFSSFTHKERKI